LPGVEKGLFVLYLLFIAVIVLLFAWFLYRLQLQHVIRPIKHHAVFSGAPQYIAGSTSGSPLSELGSHCGFKAVPETEAAGSSALFSTVTSFGAGRLYDFILKLYDDKGKAYFEAPESRKVHFRPYRIEEQARDRNLQMKSRLFFLQRNLAVMETEWESLHGEVTVKPAFLFMSTLGRDLENPYPHLNGFTFFRAVSGGIQVSNYFRFPGLKAYAYFLPSSGGSSGKKELQGSWLELKPGEKKSWSVIISFSADGSDKLEQRAERALRNLEKLKAAAGKRWSNFEESLPLPCEVESEAARTLMTSAAWALQNNLYYPRQNMKRWGSVPSKVYFPFFWGWDTPQHVMGLSEWNCKRAADILLTQVEANHWAPRQSKFRLKAKGITFLSGNQRNLIPSKINDSLRGVLGLYSQPPLQSWAALRIYERCSESEKRKVFLQQVLPLLSDNLRWWEENRSLTNGLFSFINGLESGLDDSPRFYPPSFLPSFVVGLIPRFFSAVDLNCWLFQSYMNTAYLCKEAGLEEEGSDYLSLGSKLKDRIENELWSAEDEAWLDRRGDKFIRVFTPAIWWPAFIGASSDLGRIQAVIERYLLDPKKFWGLYGIPSVAFDDYNYNSRKDGYYWRGQIWMINNYAALEVLFRYGYAREAEELHIRILDAVYASGGLFETYNAETGVMGWSSRGPGDPAVMQFGMSSAWVTQILLCRYQHFCYIFPGTRELSGYIQWATTPDQVPAVSPPTVEPAPQGAVLQVEVPGINAYRVPKLFLKSGDDKPLLQSAILNVRFEDLAGCTSRSGCIYFTWQGERFQMEPDKKYQIRPFAETEKLMMI
jgi:hypothetical protein